jgi:hypothetical protein
MLKSLPPEIAKALWAGDLDTLHELAYCACCCAEHTLSDCPARLWSGCRGQWIDGGDYVQDPEILYAEF